MNLAADTVSSSRAKKNAVDLEGEYEKFAIAGRPISTVVVAFILTTVSTVILGEVQARVNNFSLLRSQFIWTSEHTVELFFFVPALIAAIRGHRFLRPLLLGKLSIKKMFLVGVSVGTMTCYLSSIFGGRYFTPPIWHFSGFAQTLKGGLLISDYLLGPFGEEMFYQVGLQTWLQRFGPVAAILGATAPFWAYHLYGGYVPMTVAIVWLLPGMLAYALIRQITKSTGAAIIAHSTYNVLVSIFVFYPR